MSKQDPTEQIKFLVCCIGHTSNGRPDFSAVADELGIVSKAAAQKRYERMLKANGVTSTRSPTKANDEGAPSTPQDTPVKRKATAPRTAGSAKKNRGGRATKGMKKEGEEDDSNAAGEDTKEGVKKEEDTDSELSDPPESDGSSI